MPTVTVLATAHLNHSPHDVIRMELIEHLETPAAVRGAGPDRHSLACESHHGASATVP
jgi:hypothetical protein